MSEPQFRDYAVTTLPELEKAIAVTVSEALAADDWERTAALRDHLTRRLFLDACEVISAEAERIARPPYRTRRQRQQEREPA